MDNINSYIEPQFGVAGFPPAFFESEYRKKRVNIFAWVRSLSLDWVELQNTYGVKMKDEQALEYKRLARQHNIGISLHAPYYITLASGDADIVKRSVERIFQCFHLAEVIGSSRIIFHPGHFPGTSPKERKDGFSQLIRVLSEIKNDVPKSIFLYAETAGKRSQLGSVEEVVEICSQIHYVKPCLDMAHVHGFRNGELTSEEKIYAILDYIGDMLGKDVLADVHFHMYPVEVDKNGEKKHRAFDDIIPIQQISLIGEVNSEQYHPRPEHFIAALKKKRLSPVIVCEALNSQEKGARIMKDIYYQDGGQDS